MIGCAWLVYANTVGASVYPSVGAPEVVAASYSPMSSAKAGPEGHSFAARFQPLAAAAAAAPQLMASIALKAAAKRAAVLGYEGKWAIHPSQIALANEAATTPSPYQRSSRPTP